MGEETERDKDNKTAAIARGLEEFDPAISFEFLLQGEGFADFPVLYLNKVVFDIATGVDIGENSESPLVLAM